MEMRSMRVIRGFTLALCVALPLLLSACGGGGSGKPVVLTSFYPLSFFAAQIAGDRMEVRNLVPAGAEPHDWEPKPKDVADIGKAAVLIYNGAGLEHWIDSVLDAAKSDKRVDIVATDGLTLLPPPPGGRDEDLTNDPHVWLDPMLAKEVARTIADGLIAADPAGKATYEQNLAALVANLDGLDTRFRDGLRMCDRREIITSHAAFGYLARRYGLEQIAVEGLSPDSEPTPARIAAVTETARERKATHIFFETLVNPQVAETIAREVGAQTLVLDPIEGVQDERTQTYFTVMDENLANLRTALGCR
jgi:zinc transport system substrate-binding protein